MSADQLERRLTAIEHALADIQRRLDAVPGIPAQGKWWESVGLPEMTAEEREMFDEMVEYGRYFRKTGKEPPPDWKPGDPIPEPESDE
jgi:hypothetical protein